MDAVAEKLDLETVTDGDLAACYEVLRAMAAVDYPGRPIPALDSYLRVVRSGRTINGPQETWVARVADRIVATAFVVSPEPENQHLTITNVRVHPEWRRRGIGTALLATTLPDMLAAGRLLVTGQGLVVGGAGERWAASLGFTRVQEFVLQDLVVADVDPVRWEVAVPDGFRLRRWVGATPEDILGAYAAARSAITDAPHTDASPDFPDWTPERVRLYETQAAERGSTLWVLVAVHEETGAVAGLTEVDVSPARPTVIFQLDTAVPARFRGRGLGRLVKAEMMRWLLAERPGLELVRTNTAATNVYMQRVNAQIGYHIDRTVSDVQADLAPLLERLS